MSAIYRPAETGAERIGTGSPQVDEILGGGFPAGSINLLMGHPGTGKTILAEQMLFHNAGDGRPVVFLSTLSEPLSKVVSYLQRFSFYDERKMFESVVYDDIRGRHAGARRGVHRRATAGADPGAGPEADRGRLLQGRARPGRLRLAGETRRVGPGGTPLRL